MDDESWMHCWRTWMQFTNQRRKPADLHIPAPGLGSTRQVSSACLVPDGTLNPACHLTQEPVHGPAQSSPAPRQLYQKLTSSPHTRHHISKLIWINMYWEEVLFQVIYDNEGTCYTNTAYLSPPWIPLPKIWPCHLLVGILPGSHPAGLEGTLEKWRGTQGSRGWCELFTLTEAVPRNGTKNTGPQYSVLENRRKRN